MFGKDYISLEGCSALCVGNEVELYLSAPQLNLCFVNTRVTLAKGSSSLEMLCRGNKSLQYDLCSSGVGSSCKQMDGDIHKLKHA